MHPHFAYMSRSAVPSVVVSGRFNESMRDSTMRPCSSRPNCAAADSMVTKVASAGKNPLSLILAKQCKLSSSFPLCT
uniref:Uncharacterized protein n=1 Tax=Rhizophora mucronata TaxID=61149 RepID=A0A2P2J600_RHIMU